MEDLDLGSDTENEGNNKCGSILNRVLLNRRNRRRAASGALNLGHLMINAEG